jgi:hypothetical protein
MHKAGLPVFSLVIFTAMPTPRHDLYGITVGPRGLCTRSRPRL